MLLNTQILFCISTINTPRTGKTSTLKYTTQKNKIQQQKTIKCKIKNLSLPADFYERKQTIVLYRDLFYEARQFHILNGCGKMFAIPIAA